MDLLIRNGELISATGRYRASVGIENETIVGVFEPGAEPSAKETVDATNLAIVPGFVDMHAHHREGSEPGYEYKETVYSSGLQCAAGGVTTTVGMPNVVPPPDTSELLRRQLDVYRKDSVVDWNFNPVPTNLDQLRGMLAQGIAGFKIFMVGDTGRGYPHIPGIGVHDHGKILDIMEACAELNVPLMIHPHNQALMDTIEKRFWARGERDALAYAKAYAAYDGINSETAIATILRLQKATGVHLHILHAQTAGSVELIREAKAAGQRVTCEINPWTLFLSCDWSAIERLGSYALAYWVPEKNVPSLWEGMNDGTIDIVATDHAPHTREEKEIGWTDGWKAHTGMPSIQFYLSMLMSAAHEGRISFERVIDMCSTSPAEIFGLEKKGKIQPGYYADIAIVDLNAEYEVRNEDVLSLVGWSPWAGRKFKGKVVQTLLRGRTIFRDNKVVGERGFGKQAVAVRPAPVRAAAE